MKKVLSIISLFASASVAMAATATFTFSSDAGTEGNPLDFTEVLSQTSSYGGFVNTNNPYSIWCNAFVVNGNGKTVYLNITGNPFHDNYPLPVDTVKNEATNLTLNGVNLTVSGSDSKLNLNVGTATSGGTLNFYNGTLLIENGAKVGVATEGTVFPAAIESFNMNSTSDTTVIVQGGSSFYNRNTLIGNANSTGKQLVRIVGSNNSVIFRNSNIIGATNASADNVAGAVIEFIADANGISTITSVGGWKGFTPILSFDFSNLVWDESWGDEKTFTLFTGDSNTSYLSDWVDNQEINDANMAIFTGVETGTFTADNRNLYLTIARSDLNVPEPSTYAAIFGAIALAFASYRRRK